MFYLRMESETHGLKDQKRAIFARTIVDCACARLHLWGGEVPFHIYGTCFVRFARKDQRDTKSAPLVGRLWPVQ